MKKVSKRTGSTPDPKQPQEPKPNPNPNPPATQEPEPPPTPLPAAKTSSFQPIPLSDMEVEYILKRL